MVRRSPHVDAASRELLAESLEFRDAVVRATHQCFVHFPRLMDGEQGLCSREIKPLNIGEHDCQSARLPRSGRQFIQVLQEGGRNLSVRRRELIRAMPPRLKDLRQRPADEVVCLTNFHESCRGQGSVLRRPILRQASLYQRDGFAQPEIHIARSR